ncbi:similar to Saccharomyces cerevisiae YJL122W ALB1 Shuttling pre-60S factor [Maudiozyma barnettii]|uniref:Similar to Saccharomyces cerevisiae YJL122W ALB1 Shuttling pre-60S factor n=1 Tax=Maudiozyma barnettii TaxID=61262 RepID=A0A8H2VGN9_9SACH|nr:Alb1p [Kazachstania barnettii]CAB4255147.1 similar to Saccharomyces cerevisiae YJL122W ALB1 Shuttling pre-60S factor [Kazachstania barnettii]CAD1783418.1 similar to Saccharomyces cerevisiae YJL122W ALB1 Shuttling pre-60S factor [Kazachstania barnettii]
MPSKNSINRPKLTTNVRSKQHKLARKRDQRERAGHFNQARSAEGSRSGEAKSVALDIYFGKEDATTSKDQSHRGGLTNKTLSKKRAQKIERNLKYAQQRRLLTDVQADLENKDDTMNVDGGNKSLLRKQEIEQSKNKKNNMSLIREALWNAIEDTQSQGLTLATGQGTTLGGPFFP